MSTIPTLLNPWAGNPYAPSWAAVTPMLPGLCDVDFDFDPITVVLTPGQISYKNQLLVDDEADYLAREIFVAPIASAPSVAPSNPQNLKIRIVDGDGNFITSDWVTANDICGPVGAAILPLRKGSTVFVDLWNQGADRTLTVQMGFKGFRRFPCTNDQGPIAQYRSLRSLYCREWPGARFEDWEYAYEFSNGASAFFPPWCRNLAPQTPTVNFQQIPLPMEDDAGFLWRGITGMILNNGAPVGPEQFFLRFYDHRIIPMARAIPRPGLLPTPAGPGSELVTSNGGGRMTPVFQEVYIPRGSQPYVDIAILAVGASVQFSLRGLKVYEGPECAVA
jgi:hypothetical protein